VEPIDLTDRCGILKTSAPPFSQITLSHIVYTCSLSPGLAPSYATTSCMKSSPRWG